MKVYVVVHETGCYGEITGYDVGPAFASRDYAVAYIETFGVVNEGDYWMLKDWRRDPAGNAWYVEELEVNEC